MLVAGNADRIEGCRVGRKPFYRGSLQGFENVVSVTAEVGIGRFAKVRLGDDARMAGIILPSALDVKRELLDHEIRNEERFPFVI